MTQKIINLPNKIRMNDLSIEPILEQINSITSNTKKIIFNFKNTNLLHAELTTFLGSIFSKLQADGFELYTTGLDDQPKVKEILQKNSFLNVYQNQPILKDTYESTIKFVHVDATDTKKINNYLNEFFIPKLDTPIIDRSINEDIKQAFKEAIFEFADNVFTHSKSSRLFMCGQYYYQRNELKFAISDHGISIPKNIKNHGINPTLNDSDLIEWSTEEGNTTKNVPESGMGLNEIRNTMSALGEVTIISNNGYWKQTSSGRILKKEFDAPFPGTLLHLTILLNPNINKKLYTSKQTLLDSDALSFI